VCRKKEQVTSNKEVQSCVQVQRLGRSFKAQMY
jgi:hypothetical protein